MDLSRCTQGQREIIDTLDAPLMVAAGAGSGKTFTLTQRIVNALMPQGDEPAFLESIDQVLAITFTKKAAAELKGRVKAQLLSEGLRDQALAVDDAWVSTIHGMASRMLREHALELGLDPAFEVLPEPEVQQLRAEAVDVAVRALEQSGDPLMRALLASGPLFSEGGRGTGLVDRALKILARVEAMPAGFDGLVVTAPTCTPGDLVREMYELGCAFGQTAAAWPKVTATEQKMLDDLEGALERAESWLVQAKGLAFDDPSFDEDGFRRVIYAFPPTSAKFHDKKDDADFFASYRSDYARISEEAEACIAYRLVVPLIELTRMIADEYARLKGPSRMDNADLLAYAVRALRDDPGLAASYRDRFKLIMVDEFQDTDKLQVSLVNMIAQPGMANVCTVGDAQQSIYRFRGADVNVFFAYRENLRAENPDARFVSLPDNFRSHGDVLALVDAVFSQPQAFGSEFLHLEPRSAVNAQQDPLFACHPRINLDFVHYKRKSAKAKGISKLEAVEVAARHIAGHFADLRDRGARAGNMALLLGSMSHADIYARELRACGIESVIAGGSIFASSSEAQLVGALLRYAVNTSDEPALFEVLTSLLFAISDDVLLSLVSTHDERGAFRSRSLSQGFAARDEAPDESLGAGDAQSLELARKLLGRFAQRARAGRVSDALRDLLVQTGALDRLEQQGAAGLASAGNLAKALHLVSGFERDATGVAALSRAYAEQVRCAKEAPGALATVDADFVRIMTVHASKGLEFPHVAVAELGTGVASRDALLVENVGDNTYLAASTSALGEYETTVNKLRKYEREDEPGRSPACAQSPGERFAALDVYARAQTLSESQRLLYVALTRASRSLYVSYVSGSKPQDCYENEGIYRDLFTALGWDVETKKSVTMAEYGGSAPARITLEYLVEPEDACAPELLSSATEPRDGEPFVIAQRDVPPAPMVVPCSFAREDVSSYSSLEHQEPDVDLLGDARGLEGAAELAHDEDDDATSLGTAFHRLAQRAVVERSQQAPDDVALHEPSEQALCAQARLQGLSTAQQQRLRVAVSRWFSCELAHEAASYERVEAEVPFMVQVPHASPAEGFFFLEGEIDLLATSDDRRALVVDYKTGGYSFETQGYLHEKHKLQAQCYAYALLVMGFDEVDARFVRVEQPCDAHNDESQAVRYSFVKEDVPSLAQVIAAARR